MLPKIPILRLPDSLDIPLPKYQDGIGTSMVLAAAISEPIKIAPGEFTNIPTGFQFALPLGMEAQIRSLSPFSETIPIVVLNAPMTIDSSNHNPISITLKNTGNKSVLIRRGQPIALLVFSPVLRVIWEEVEQSLSIKNQKDKSIDYHTSRGKDTPAEGKEQENKSISGEKASQPNMKRLNISPSESLSEERTMTSPFIPPDIEEIAHETITTPEAIGPITEKNALQDALQDEEALSQESSASASSSGEKKKENFLDKITKKIFTSPMSPPTEEEEKHD